MPCNTCGETVLEGLPPQAAGSPGSCGLRPVLWAETPGHWYSLEQNVQRSGCFFSWDFLGFCANGITGAFQLLAPCGATSGQREGWGGLTSLLHPWGFLCHAFHSSSHSVYNWSQIPFLS